MKKLFVVVTIACLGIILVSISAQAGGLAFDAVGNLFERGKDSIFKFTPDGNKSTFASGLNSTSGVYNLAFDAAGNLFVSDPDSHSILKFTPDGTSSSFAVDVSSTSPDKKWEFVGGGQPRILEAGTHQVVLDLSEDRGRGGLVWGAGFKTVCVQL